MKAGQYFALITGIMFLLVGIMGFVPGLVHNPAIASGAAGLGVSNGYGDLMGLFPINFLHNIVHITVGLLGIVASIALDGARTHGRALAAFYGLLAIMGLIRGLNTTFGLIPIFGNDVWLHALPAAIAFYFGFIDSPKLLDIAGNPQNRQTTGV